MSIRRNGGSTPRRATGPHASSMRARVGRCSPSSAGLPQPQMRSSSCPEPSPSCSAGSRRKQPRGSSSISTMASTSITSARRLTFPNPFGDRPAIVFTGAMDYRPNVEAMTWFVGQVLPRLRAHPTAPCLWIVGSKPSRAVLALTGPDVRVTGRDPGCSALSQPTRRLVVAPLQIARGIQNKVLEAMAMGAPVVVTPEAREGLDRCRDDELLTAGTPVAFADAVSRVLGGEAGQIGTRARACVIRDYGWPKSLVGPRQARRQRRSGQTGVAERLAGRDCPGPFGMSGR